MYILKKLNNHYHLLSETKLYNDEWCYAYEKDKVCRFVDLSEVGVGQGAFLKIIASTDETIDNIPYLHIPKIEKLIGVVNVEDLASKWALDNVDSTMESNSALNRGFIGGYNQALKDNADKLFTMKDMEKCFSAGITFSNVVNKFKSADIEPYKFYKFIEKINNVKTWRVVVEEILVQPDAHSETKFEPFLAPKITDGYINIIKIFF